METYFSFIDEIPQEIEVGVEPLASNYSDMVSAIVIGEPDNRLLPDNSND